MLSDLIGNFTDKIYVFVTSDGSVSFVLPWIDPDAIVLTIGILITIWFFFETLFVFIGRWKKFK